MNVRVAVVGHVEWADFAVVFAVTAKGAGTATITGSLAHALSPRASSSAEAGRSCGSFARQRSSSAAMAGGVPGARSCSGGAVSRICIVNSSRSDSATKGSCPVSIS